MNREKEIEAVIRALSAQLKVESHLLNSESVNLHQRDGIKRIRNITSDILSYYEELDIVLDKKKKG